MSSGNSRKIDAFKLWCWRRLLRVFWTARRANQSILKRINSEYSLEGWSWSSGTLATWCKWPTHWKRPWCWERLREGEGDDRGWDGWHHRLSGHEFEWTPGDSEGQRSLVGCGPWSCKELDMTGLLTASWVNLKVESCRVEHPDENVKS